MGFVVTVCLVKSSQTANDAATVGIRLWSKREQHENNARREFDVLHISKTFGGFVLRKNICWIFCFHEALYYTEGIFDAYIFLKTKVLDRTPLDLGKLFA